MENPDLIQSVNRFLKDSGNETLRTSRFIDNLTRATSIKVNRFAKEIASWPGSDGLVEGGAMIDVMPEGKRFNNPVFAGYVIANEARFGVPDSEPGIPPEKALETCSTELGIVVATRASFSAEEAEDIMDGLKDMSSKKDFGLRFNVKSKLEPSDPHNPLATDRIIFLENVTNTQGEPLNIRARINLGYSDDISDLLDRGKTLDETQEARKKLEENAQHIEKGEAIDINNLVVPFVIPRPNSFAAVLQDAQGGELLCQR